MLASPQPVVISDKLDELEAHMLELPQAECPVVHRFGPGIYIREVTLPAGAIAIGHAQRFEHTNIMLTGAVMIVGDDGQPNILRAPLFFVGKPGRKVGYVLETCVWQNVYATDETDIDVLEATYLDKSPTWLAHDAATRLSQLIDRQADRDDFHQLLDEAGINPTLVRQQSEHLDDQTTLPDGYPKITVRISPIEGLGIFLSAPADAGEVLGPARLGGYRTPLGRYTNHAKHPNAKFVLANNGDIYLIALSRITGCAGGSPGDEVTVDYRQSLVLASIQLNQGAPL